MFEENELDLVRFCRDDVGILLVQCITTYVAHQRLVSDSPFHNGICIESIDGSKLVSISATLTLLTPINRPVLTIHYTSDVTSGTIDTLSAVDLRPLLRCKYATSSAYSFGVHTESREPLYSSYDLSLQHVRRPS